jgi:hypothetical protein
MLQCCSAVPRSCELLCPYTLCECAVDATTAATMRVSSKFILLLLLIQEHKSLYCSVYISVCCLCTYAAFIRRSMNDLLVACPHRRFSVSSPVSLIIHSGGRTCWSRSLTHSPISATGRNVTVHSVFNKTV